MYGKVYTDEEKKMKRLFLIIAGRETEHQERTNDRAEVQACDEGKGLTLAVDYAELAASGIGAETLAETFIDE